MECLTRLTPLFSEETCGFGRGEGGQGGKAGEALPVVSPSAGVAASLVKLLRPLGLVSDLVHVLTCLGGNSW